MKTYRHHGILYHMEKEGDTHGYFDTPFLGGKWWYDPETKEIDIKNSVYKAGVQAGWNKEQQEAILEWFGMEIACDYPPLSDVLDVEREPGEDAAEKKEDRGDL